MNESFESPALRTMVSALLGFTMGITLSSCPVSVSHTLDFGADD